jgi:general L-amino acid transport system substrate-binding protein
MIVRPSFWAVALIGAMLLPAVAEAGTTMDAVKKRGILNCGVGTGLAGFSLPDAQGNWTGLDVDTCRAIAASVLGGADKVKFFPYNAQQRFTALQSGEIDVLARNTTATSTRDTGLGVSFAPVTFFDGQGFMVKANLGVKSAKELGGATVCVQQGTTTELNLTDYFRTNKMDLKPVVYAELPELQQAFFSGRCDAFTTDSSQLAGVRAGAAAKPDDYVILPEIISKEPLAPAYRVGDNEWAKVVNWTIYALFQAEESGITKANVDQMLKTDNPDIKRLLGVTPGGLPNVGVDDQWAYRAIKQVGNYGEIFERNVGQGSSLKLKRGLNAQWKEGGLIYALPIR